MTNDLSEPITEPLSPNEQDSLRQAAEDAIFAGMAPTDAEMRLSNQYQALQQHDDLTESVLAHKDAYRAREMGPTTLTSQQAAALIAEGRHMQPRAKAHFNYAQKAHEQYLRRATDRAFIAEIVQRVNGTPTAPDKEETQSALEPNLQPTNSTLEVPAPQSEATGWQQAPGLPEDQMPGGLNANLPHAPDMSASSEDEEPQGGLGPNFKRENRAALLGIAPSARRANPVLSLLSTSAPRHEHAAAEPTCAPAPADSDAPVALAPDLSGAAQFTAPAPEFDATAREASAASAPSSATTPSNLAGMANTTVDEPAQPAATTESAPRLDSEAGTQSYQATAPMPPDFAVLALDFESCRKLVAPVLAQVRATEDETLGQRYAHMREAAYSFYQLEEDIFGTGFDHGEQRTHLMLEFLAVLASQNQSDPFAVAQSDEWGRFAFLKRRNLILRQILFNNPELGIIAATTQQDEAKWQQWFEQFSAKLQSMTDSAFSETVFTLTDDE